MVGCVIFGHHQQAAGVLVNTVHNAGADGAANAGQLPRTVVEQRIDQRAVRVAGCRVDNHPLRLVDHQKVVILIDNIQRDVLGYGLDGLRVEQVNGIDSTGKDLFLFVDRRAVPRHKALLHQPLQRTAGQCRALPCQPGIQAACVTGRSRKLKPFHRPPPSAVSAHPFWWSPEAAPASAGQRPHRRRYPQN